MKALVYRGFVAAIDSDFGYSEERGRWEAPEMHYPALTDSSAEAVACDGSVAIGDAYIDGSFVRPVVDLGPVKQAKTFQINQWRASANQTYFTHSGKQIACDQLSRSDIDAVANSIALTGAFPAGFPGAWKAIDNSYILLPDVNAFKAMHASMTAQGTINFGRSQDLKMALAAATTVEQVAAITWA